MGACFYDRLQELHPMKTISIVIPVHDRANIVTDTLECVRHQTWRPLKVVLVDNASTDDTLAVLNEWKAAEEAPGFEVKVVTEQKPGAAAARNRGLREVDSDYVMFFDSDDLMKPTHVERAMRAFEADPEADIVGWDTVYRGLGGKSRITIFADRDALWHNIMHGSMATQRYAVRTSLVNAAGGWGEDVMGWNDVELGCRLLAASPRIVKLRGEPTVVVLARENSITGNSFASGAEKWEHSLDTIEASLSRWGKGERYVSLRRAILAGHYTAEGAIEEGLRLIRRVLRNEPSWAYRQLFKVVFTYSAHGGRGAARLVRVFFK